MDRNKPVGQMILDGTDSSPMTYSDSVRAMLSQPRTLLSSPPIYKPLKYEWAYEGWMLQQRMHWLADEIHLGDDAIDWKQKLTSAEQNLMTQVFRAFTQQDVEVFGYYVTKLLDRLQPIEVRMLVAGNAAMECVHVAAYARPPEVFGMDDTINEEFLNHREMRDKCDLLHEFMDDSDSLEGFAILIAYVAAFVEGLQLFGSFVSLMWPQTKGVLCGVGQIGTYSVRDETIHTIYMSKIFRTLIDENPDLWTDRLKNKLYRACENVVLLEDKFLDLAYEMLPNKELMGMKLEDVKVYMRFLADRRLAQLRLDPIYRVAKNPMPWVDHVMNGLEHSNFFEIRSTEYTKGSSTGTWEDAFAIHDSALAI